MNLHACAAFLLARAAHLPLKASGGAIVATASMAGTVQYAGNGAYPSKGHAHHFVPDAGSRMGGGWNSCQCRIPRARVQQGARKVLFGPAELTVRQGGILLGRVGKPEDVAGVISFLLGPDAAFITGQNILVDVGLVASSQTHPSRRAPVT
jgi:NAD(P)-dependent dehydrogenase (short-subunit alcohol dehydrogenase family)